MIDEYVICKTISPSLNRPPHRKQCGVNVHLSSNAVDISKLAIDYGQFHVRLNKYHLLRGLPGMRAVSCTPVAPFTHMVKL